MTTVPTIALNDGHRLPAIGLGTYGIEADAVATGIDAGFRLLDTALNYGNEQHVGRAVAASVVPRWHVQLGALPIPRSANAQRQAENIDIFGFELSAEEVASICALESGRRVGADPETNEEL